MGTIISGEYKQILAERGLIFALEFADAGLPRRLDWYAINQQRTPSTLLWVHIQANDTVARNWLETQAGLDELTAVAMLTEETRPRVSMVDDCLLVILYGINAEPAADPDDMISIRLWIEPHRVISVRGRSTGTFQNIADDLRSGVSEPRPGAILAEVAAAVTARMGVTLVDLEEQIDILESKLLATNDNQVRSDLTKLRRQVITIRRYLAPQRDVLNRLSHERVTWLTEDDRAHLHETADQLFRYVEDLDLIRERMIVTENELTAQNSDRLNRSMYRLALVTVIFLPLTFVTGLLGINVAGIPSAGHEQAFLIVCLLMVVLFVAELIVLRLLQWF